MKKIIPLLVLSLLLSASLHAQVIKYDIQIKYVHEASGTTADITVTVLEGQPGFTYYLMTNDPIKGEVLAKSEKTRKKTWVFRGVRPGKYFLKIEDSTGIQAGKTVNIIEN
jgi:hypothetical protein